MYENIGYILGAAFIVLGISFQFLPGEKLVLKDKLKPGTSFEDAVKKMRRFGVFYIIGGALIIISRYIMLNA